ncbi:CAP domain-containing protein [Streptomyces sp. NPDC053427]|uniref:CAP domain-containing protein n=1 Tax=Streptomyces sp. NPDC053427 TaxID=3365701 RepID=UPI0037CE8D94
MNRATETPTDDQYQPQHPPRQAAGRHGRRRGAHRGRRPRWVVAAGGVAALTAVVGGGYGVAQSLADTPSGDTRTAAEEARRAEATSLPIARSAAPSATPTPKPSRKPSAARSGSPKPTAGGRSSSPRKSARPKTTPTAHTDARPAPRTGAPGGGSTSTTDRLAQRVVELVNAERAKKGCSPVTVNAKLRAAAQGHSDDMAARDYYDHTTPEGIDPGDRMTSAGYHWITYGENIYKSPKDAQTAMAGWMKSPGHRDNILNCAFKEIGVGINLRSNGPWWTQNFGASS